MQKKTAHKLSLNRETLRTLQDWSDGVLEKAVGGTFPPTFPCTTTCSDSFCDSLCP